MKVQLDVNKLSLNTDKTIFIIVKSPQHPSLNMSIKNGNLPVKKLVILNFLVFF